MKPPVEAPASRQRRPCDGDGGERLERPGELVPAPGDVLDACRPAAGTTTSGGAGLHRRGGLRRGGAAGADPSGRDQRGGGLTGAGQAPAHQLGVEPGPSDHRRHTPSREAGRRRAAGAPGCRSPRARRAPAGRARPGRPAPRRRAARRSVRGRADGTWAPLAGGVRHGPGHGRGRGPAGCPARWAPSLAVTSPPRLPGGGPRARSRARRCAVASRRWPPTTTAPAR